MKLTVPFRVLVASAFRTDWLFFFFQPIISKDNRAFVHIIRYCSRILFRRKSEGIALLFVAFFGESRANYPDSLKLPFSQAWDLITRG